MLCAVQARSAPGRALIEQRERHLVREDLDAARDRHAEMGGVDVGQAEVADEPPVLSS